MPWYKERGGDYKFLQTRTGTLIIKDGKITGGTRAGAIAEAAQIRSQYLPKTTTIEVLPPETQPTVYQPTTQTQTLTPSSAVESNVFTPQPSPFAQFASYQKATPLPTSTIPKPPSKLTQTIRNIFGTPKTPSQMGMSIAPEIVLQKRENIISSLAAQQTAQQQAQQQDINAKIQQRIDSEAQYYQELINQGMDVNQVQRLYAQGINDYARELYRGQGYQIVEGKYQAGTGTYTSPMGEQYSYAQELIPQEFAVYKPLIRRVPTSEILPQEPIDINLGFGGREYWKARTGAGAEMDLSAGTYTTAPPLEEPGKAGRIIQSIFWGGEAYKPPEAIVNPKFAEIGGLGFGPLPGGEGAFGGWTFQQIRRDLPEKLSKGAGYLISSYTPQLDVLAGRITKTSTAAPSIVLTETAKRGGKFLGETIAVAIPETPLGIGSTAALVGLWGKLPKAVQYGGNLFFGTVGTVGALNKNLPAPQRVASGIIGGLGFYGAGRQTYQFFKPTTSIIYKPYGETKGPISFDEMGKTRYTKALVTYKRIKTTTSQFRESFLGRRLGYGPTTEIRSKILFTQPGVLKIGGKEIPVAIQTTPKGKTYKIFTLEGKTIGSFPVSKTTLKVQEGVSIWEVKPSDFKLEISTAEVGKYKFTPEQKKSLRELGIIIGKGKGTSIQIVQSREGLYGELIPSSEYQISQVKRTIISPPTKEGVINIEMGKEIGFKSTKMLSEKINVLRGGGSKSSPEFFEKLYGKDVSLIIGGKGKVAQEAASLTKLFVPQVTIPKSTQAPLMVGGQGLEFLPYAGIGLYEKSVTDVFKLKPKETNILISPQESKVIPISVLSLTQKASQDAIIFGGSKSVLEPKISPTIIDLQETPVKISEAQTQLPTLRYGTALKLETPQTLIPKLYEKQVIKPRELKLKPREKTVIRLVPTYEFGTQLPSKALKRLKKKKPSSVDVFTRVRGKEVLLASSVTERAALDIGTSQTLFGVGKATALSASIILKPSKAPARKVVTKGEYGKYKDIFRIGKVPGKGAYLTLVQREKSRLAFPQERKRIVSERRGGFKI